MSQEMKEAGTKHCYACIQWNGQRSLHKDTNKIMVDAGSEGICLITRKKQRGNWHCDQFFPLR